MKKEEEMDKELTLEALGLSEEEIEAFLDTFKKIKLRWMRWGHDEEDGKKVFFFTFFRVTTQKAYSVVFPKEAIEVLKKLRKMLDDFIGQDEKEKESLRAYE